MPRKKLSEILTAGVVNVSPATPVSQAIRIMRTKNISCIVILEENKPIGIFTERNVVRHITQQGMGFYNCEIRKLMSSPVLTANKNMNIYTAYNLLGANKIRHLVVVDHENRAVGVVTQSDMIECLGYEYFVEFKKLSQIMTKTLVTISKDITVYQALTKMAQNSISCLIIAQDDHPLGILTERDVGRLLIDYSDISQLKVEEVMSSPVQTASRDTMVHEIVKFMQQKNIRRVVVIDKDGKIVGLTTQFDIIKGLEAKYIETLKQLIKEKDVKIRNTLKDLAEKTAYIENILLSSIYMGIVATDLNFRITYYNPCAEQILGHTAEEVIGRDIRKIHFQKNIGLSKFDRIFETIPKNKSHTFIFEQDIKDSKRFIHTRVSGIWDQEQKLVGFVLILCDITERKRAEEEKKNLEARLRQVQKMEAIGTLAGGIAHDFNNMLMGIQGNVSLMLLDLDPAHPHCKRLKSIEKQVQGGARLTSDFLGYARKGKYEVKLIDLNEIVKQTSDTFGRTKKEITIRRELAQDLFAIKADQGQIEQVLLNLYINAADAMPDGGQLILKTMNMTHKHMKSPLYELSPGNYVLLRFTDTGSGIDKEIMERIFEPFFTTKEMGKGTGLGLASVYGIIKAHGGYIDVESKKGHGTTFSIYLPESEKEVQEVVVKTPVETIKGTETILLVDDEEVILEVGKDLLEALGYRVLLARDGKEAIEVYKKNQDEIDIVVLDMVMPTMGGGEAYDKMKEINPKVKVLLSSGYSIDSEAAEILKRGCKSFIQKPFMINVLAEEIRDILNKK
jgi:two-component system cell cycle sensor histidine kinase/response regulator CckA